MIGFAVSGTRYRAEVRGREAIRACLLMALELARNTGKAVAFTGGIAALEIIGNYLTERMQ